MALNVFPPSLIYTSLKGLEIIAQKTSFLLHTINTAGFFKCFFFPNEKSMDLFF